jgi:D-alanyl-D-alanine dipeptidase
MAGASQAMTMWMDIVKTIAILLVAATVVSQAHAQTLPGGFVYLRDLDPTILQDIRYASSNNFIGRPMHGYDAAECVVKREVALKLKAIQADLAKRKLSLKMFDCYRPTRATADMRAWSRDGRDSGRRFNPKFDKRDLFRLGYISPYSQHSTGAALDLTLVDLTADNSATFDPSKTYADCTAPVALRAPEESIDMGTGYDCTDLKGHTASSAITPEQRHWRGELVAVMRSQGFVNYFREWWHFSLPGAAWPAYDFPIEPRRK